jgi:signal transduction histidine kinase
MNGIFRRIFLATLAVVLFVILLSSILLNQSLARFFTAEKQEFLLSTAGYINTLLVRAARDELTTAELTRAVNDVGETANARIVILDFTAVPNPGRDTIRKTLGTDDSELISGIEQILTGETIFRQRQYDRDLGVNVVAVGVPARMNQQITGAIILFSPVYQIDSALGQTRRIIVAVALVSFVFALIIVLLSATTIAQPIVHVSQAATRFAAGLPVEDLPVSGSDELATLVRSFNEMKNKISALEKMRQELLADVSHELRTPLTAIRGFVQGIVDGVIPEKEQKKYLQQTLTETQRLSNLISQLLDTARLESGTFALQKKEIDFTALSKETVRLLIPSAAAAGIALSVQPGEKTLVCADPDRLRQVLWNLLGNAIRYNRPGGSVSVQITETAQEAHVTIHDTGTGIPADDLPFVFEKFYRADKTPAAARSGTGLGLFVAKQIIEQHGGRIWLHSVFGEGTTVTFSVSK